jgi:hypothetical protein
VEPRGAELAAWWAQQDLRRCGIRYVVQVAQHQERHAPAIAEQLVREEPQRDGLGSAPPQGDAGDLRTLALVMRREARSPRPGEAQQLGLEMRRDEIGREPLFRHADPQRAAAHAIDPHRIARLV